MSKLVLCGLLFIFIVTRSASSCTYGNVPGKVCGRYPWTFCCPMNSNCGSYASRTCYTQSSGPGVLGIIFFVIVGLLILITILKVCMVCCSSKNAYHSLSSSDSANLARAGAVVCTVAATHC